MAIIEGARQRPTGKPRRGRATRSAAAPAGRRVRVTIRRINPWSVLRFCLIFYFCLLIVVLLGSVMLWLFMEALGVVDGISDSLVGLGFGNQEAEVFEINGGYVFRMLTLIGLVSVVLWSAFTMFVVFLYNLISDLVGGIEVTLNERR